MEKKLLGIIMLVLGICGLIVAGMVFVNGNGSFENIVHVTIYIISGAALFFAGLDFAMPQKNMQSSTATSPVRKELDRL